MLPNTRRSYALNILLGVAALLVVAVFVWQALTADGTPDPTTTNLTPTAAIVDTGILVFREGLEAILVLTAITASLVRTQNAYWKPITTGAGLSFLATIVTWFVVVGIISVVNAPELDIQAATGLLAIIVLLVIMNWFFHRIYWTGWINRHNRKKRELISTVVSSRSSIYNGLLLLGFTSVYREGFEVVLFLQSIRLQVGSGIVLAGSMLGLALTLVVAGLTFISHHRLPYRKMLVLTGVMLGVVLIVMVGENVQEMQQAGWISTTAIDIRMPAWLNLWFAVYPTVESLLSQMFAAMIVLGSYITAEYVRVWKPRRQAASRLEK